MVASLFRTDIEWRRTTHVSNIDILVSQAPFPNPPDELWLVVAESAHAAPVRVQLMGPPNATSQWLPSGPDGKQFTSALLQPGGWFGVVTPTATWSSQLTYNVGPATFQILVSNARKLNWMYAGDHDAKNVTTGERWSAEILSVAADIHTNLQTVDQLLALREYLAAPEGFALTAGSLVDRKNTLLEIKPDGGVAKFALPPPTGANNVTGPSLMVPLRFGPFNRNHSVGVWQTAGYTKGLYGGGADRWSTLGLDDDGFAYLPVYPSRAEHTAAAVGCPVTMTGAGAESLFLQVTHVSEKPQTWHVSVNNPSLSATVTVRVADAGMELAGLRLESQTVTVPPGGMAVLL